MVLLKNRSGIEVKVGFDKGEAQAFVLRDGEEGTLDIPGTENHVILIETGPEGYGFKMRRIDNNLEDIDYVSSMVRL